MKKIRLSPFLRDLVTTGATSIITVVCLIVMTRWLATGLGPDGFGVYALSKRIVSYLLPVVTMGMSIAIARSLAVVQTPADRQRVLLGGLLLGIVPGVVVFMFGWVWSEPLAAWAFNGPGYQQVWMVVVFMLLTYSLYTMLYAVYRGLGRMNRANLWQLALIVVGPLLITWWLAGPGRVMDILLGMSILLGVSIIPLGWMVIHGLRVSMTYPSHPQACLRSLASYGIPRMPAGFALAGILAVGPLLAPHYGTVADAGYLVAGQSVFALAGTGIVAFGLIVLPHAAKLFAAGNIVFLRERIADVLEFAVHVGLFVSIHLAIWARPMLIVWLGEDYAAAVPLMRIMIIGLLPNLIYVMARSLIDAVETRAVNTINLLTAFVVTAAASGLTSVMGCGLVGLAASTALGLLVLAVMTLRYLWRSGWLLTGTIKAMVPGRILLVNLILGIVALVIYYFAWPDQPHRACLTAFMVEGLVVAVYILFLYRWKIGWIRQITARMFALS